MAGGLGDVNVKLTLDDSSARQTIKSFFDDFGNQKPKDPLVGLDKSFEKVAKAAKQLGFDWDKTTQSFKDDNGFSANLQEMETNIKDVRAAAKASETTFKNYAQSVKAAGAEAKGLKGTTAAMAQSIKETGNAANEAIGKIKSIGTTTQNAGNSFEVLGTNAKVLNGALQGVGTGGAQGLKNVGEIATTTGQRLDSLSKESGQTDQAIKQLAKGGAQGVNKVGTDAQAAASKLDSLEKEAKSVKSALNNVGGNAQSGLTSLATAAGAASTSFKGATSATQGLNKAISGTAKSGQPLGSLAKAIQSVGTAGANAKAPTTSLTKALNAAGKSASPLQAVPPHIRNIGQAANSAKGAAGGLGAELTKAGKQTKAFSGAVTQGFQQILQGIPQGIGIAIGNALIAPLKLLTQVIPTAITQYKQLDEVLRLTLAIAGESSSNFGRLSEAVMKVGTASAATNQEVGQVAQALARAGFSLDEIESSLAGIVQGAEATGMGYAQMGDIVVSALGQFQIEADKTTDVVDSLVVAANSSNQTVSDLGDALKYVGPVANTVGQSLDETNVQLALLANSGIKASTAGTSLRTILTNLQIAAGGAGEEFTALSRGSGRLQKVLSLIGADMTDANGELKTGTDLVYALQESMRSLGAGERAIVSKVLAGSEGLPALSAIVNATGSDIEALADKMDNKLGTAARTQQTAMEGLSGSLKFFDSALSTLLTSVGEVAAALFKPLVDGATLLMQAFNAIPGPIKSVLIVLTGLATAAAALKVALMALKTEIIATFAANTIAMIQKFGAAFTAGNIQSAILAMATNAGRLATILKGKLVLAIAASTKALDFMTASLIRVNTQLTIKNIKESIGNLKNFGDAIKGGLKNLKGKEGALGKLSQAFNKGAKSAAPMTQQLNLFSTAGGAAAGGLKGTATAANAAQTALAGVAGPAKAGAAATGAVGAKAAGAGLGLKALGGSVVAFLGAAAPFIPLVAGIGAIIAGTITYNKEYNRVTNELAGDLAKLTQVIDKNKDSTEASEEVNRTWSESIERSLGWAGSLLKVLDKFVTGGAIKFIIDGFQWLTDKTITLFGYFKDNAAINGLKDSMRDLAFGFGEASKKMEENRAKMEGLGKETKEYRNLLKDNIRIQQGVVDVTNSRIEKLKNELKTLDENGKGNDRVATTIKKQIEVLQSGLPAQEQRLAKLKQEFKEVNAATGANDSLTTSYQAVARARNEANASIDATRAAQEVQAMAAVRTGLLSETEARAMVTKAVVDANAKKLANDEHALQELIRLRDEEKITEVKFQEQKEQIVGKIKTSLEDRIESEKAAKDAIIAAIEERLNAYQREQQTIAGNVQAINTSLGQLGQINTSGIGAFKQLADASTNYEIAGIEKAKAAKLKAIDATYKDGAAKEAAKQRVERAFEREKQKILQAQQTFAEQAQQATFAAKQAELELWYAQQTVQNQLAQVEAGIAIERAKANGATAEELRQLENVKRLTEFQGTLLEDQKRLKGELLSIENQAAEAGLAAKARADGTRTAFAGSVENVGTLSTKMDAFTGKVQAVADKAKAFQTTLGEVGTVTAQQVGDSVRDKINAGLGAIDTTQVENSLRQLGIPPEIRATIAEDMTASILSGTAAGVDQAKMKVVEVFGNQGFVPKQMIEDQLVGAFTSGGQMSIVAAKNEFDKLPDALPFERIAQILGSSLEGGTEAGRLALNSLTLDATTVERIKEAGRAGLKQAGTNGATDFNSAMQKTTPELSKAVATGVKSGLTQAETEVEAWGTRVGATVEQAVSGAGTQLSKGIIAELNTVTGEIEMTFGTLPEKINGEQISGKIRESLSTPIAEAAEALSTLTAPEGLKDSIITIEGGFIKAEAAGLSTETATVANQANKAKGSIQKVPGAMNQAANNAGRFAGQLERAARAAQRAAQYKFAGGPVSPGQTYTVNEFGREMFQSNTGRISEIKVPKFGQWTPPTSGTVIPAHIANQIRDDKENAKVSKAMTSIASTGLTKIKVQQASNDSGNLQRALVRELKKLDNGGSVSNQITIQSQAPVNDASRMLAEMNRLRAYRR